MEGETCEFCGALIPEEDRADHDAGRDITRPSCPHQDLEQFDTGQRWEPGVTLPDEW